MDQILASRPTQARAAIRGPPRTGPLPGRPHGAGPAEPAAPESAALGQAG